MTSAVDATKIKTLIMMVTPIVDKRRKLSENPARVKINPMINPIAYPKIAGASVINRVAHQYSDLLDLDLKSNHLIK